MNNNIVQPMPASAPDHSAPDHTAADHTVATEKMSAKVRAWFRRRRTWFALAGVVVAVAIAGVMAQPQDRSVLSPSNPAPTGSMAVAEVLRAQGVTVHEADSLNDAVRTLGASRGGAAENSTTLLFYDPDQRLDAAGLARLRGLSDRLVLIRPSFDQLRVLAPSIRSAGLLGGDDATLPAHCRDDNAQAAKSIRRGGFGYRGPIMCFPADDSGASYVTDEARTTVVLGNEEVLQNEHLPKDGHAALTLRTLGSTPQLIWYRPTLADIPVTDSAPTPQELLPQWVRPAILWLLLSALLLIAWKGRRHGPLVAEPLPVVVRAAETAEGRARLYYDGRSILRAAETLRAATLARLAARLKLSPTVDPSAVIAEIGRLGPRKASDVARLIHHTPAGDAEFVEWAQELLALEKEVDTE